MARDFVHEDVRRMVVFSSPEAAMREGFQVVEFNREVDLYVVVKDFQRPDGRRARAIAFARRTDEGVGR
jgi:hypothetical protein